MEVEVKLSILNSSNFEKFKTLIKPFHFTTLYQENHFFDTPTNDLSLNRSVLRIRIVGNGECSEKAVVCLKSRPVLVNGVSRVEEYEEEIDVSVARNCVADPSILGNVECGVLRRCKEEFGVVGEKGVVGLGGFKNVRNVYNWRGLKLEVDETMYEFGTCYEIECESEDPESVKKELEGFLKENGIEYKYSEMTKFGVFRSGKLP
ncbi:hypothetical protein ACFE04_009088 [Oxalis oulophora]